MFKSLIIFFLFIVSANAATVTYPVDGDSLADPDTWSAPYTMIRERMTAYNQGRFDVDGYKGWWADTYFGLSASVGDYQPDLTIAIRLPSAAYESGLMRRLVVDPYGGETYQLNIDDPADPGYWPIYHAPIPWLAEEISGVARDIRNTVPWVERTWDGASGPGTISSFPGLGSRYIRTFYQDLDMTESGLVADGNIEEDDAYYGQYLTDTLSLSDYLLPDQVSIPDPAGWFFEANMRGDGISLGSGYWLKHREEVLNENFAIARVRFFDAPLGSFAGNYAWNGSGFVNPYTGAKIIAYAGNTLLTGYEPDTDITDDIGLGSLPPFEILRQGTKLPGMPPLDVYSNPSGGYGNLQATDILGGYVSYSNGNWRVSNSVGLEFNNSGTWVAMGNITSEFDPSFSAEFTATEDGVYSAVNGYWIVTKDNGTYFPPQYSVYFTRPPYGVTSSTIGASEVYLRSETMEVGTPDSPYDYLFLRRVGPVNYDAAKSAILKSVGGDYYSAAGNGGIPYLVDSYLQVTVRDR